MAETAAALPRTMRVPPRVTFEELPRPLQELVGNWRIWLAEEFRGLTTDGVGRNDLFRLQRTGITTTPILEAAQAFLATLSDKERERVTFDIDGEVWRTWSNIHRNIMRHGLCLAELGDRQREALFTFTRTALGARAHETMRNVMRLNEHLAALNGLPEEYGEGFYWISVYGTPSPDQPWGWQMDGHHVNISCLIVGDQLVLSPMLLGAEPVTAESEPYKGISVLREEEAEGWALMDALTPEQRKAATLGHALPFDGYASGFRDNVVIPYQGAPARGMTAAQRDRLAALIRRYTDRLPEGHAKLRYDEATAYLDETWFAWIGKFDAVSPFYYRVHNPVIYIEFYHQPGVALPGKDYTRRHAHALMRTPNGNDYGRVLLRQWREQEGG